MTGKMSPSRLPQARLSLALTSLLLLLHILSPAAEGRLFVLLDPETAKPCIMVDVDFSLYFTAVQGDVTVAEATRGSDDEGIAAQGSCGEISSVLNLFFANGDANWALKFSQSASGEVTLDKLVQFVPNKLFGATVPSTDFQLLDDPGTVDLGSSDTSYECPVEEVTDYQPVTVTTEDYNFTVSANVLYIHAQAFNIENGTFSEAVICKAAQNTTTTSPPGSTTVTVTTPTTTTTAADTTTPVVPKTTTLAPTPGLNEYKVVKDNTTCIVLKAALTLIIKYPVKPKTRGENGKMKKATICLPEGATASGDCDLSPTSQLLAISFYDDWKLSFTFSRDEKNLFRSFASISAAAADDENTGYRISEVKLTAYADEAKFPDISLDQGSQMNYELKGTDFPHVSAKKGFYKCKNSLDTHVGADATVKSNNMEFKAFNRDNDDAFSGAPAQCGADCNGSRRRTLIIVGCVLAGIVLVSFIVFVVMRIARRRRSNYQYLQ